jgi:hypothetical protein
VGEQVIPLARNFNGVNVDIESQNVPLVRRMVPSFTWEIKLRLFSFNLFETLSSPSFCEFKNCI